MGQCCGMDANFGAIVGYLLYGTIADLQGRETASYLFCVTCLLVPPFLYFSTQHIFILLCLAASTSAFTSVLSQKSHARYLDFPAAFEQLPMSFIFNAPRFISLGPLLARTIIAKLGGYQ